MRRRQKAAPNLIAADAPVLELRGVTRVYGQATRTVALHRADLIVRRGDYLAIVGPSGSGKSTLLNIIGLLDSPSEGKYLVQGHDTSTMSERKRNRLRAATFGFVFQASHVIGNETAASNAALSLEIAGVSRRLRTAKVFDALALLGVEARASALGKNLSGGERQRVAIARAIANSPDIVLADEPTGALDSENSRAVIEHLGALNAGGVTVVVITHDESVAAQATRRVVIRDGVLTDQEPNASASSSLSPGTSRPELPRSRFRALGLDFLKAVSAHTSSPGRSLVLILAFLLGAGGLVSAIGVSQSAANQVSERLTAAALDEVGITSSELQSSTQGDEAARDARLKLLGLHGVTGVGRSANLSAQDAPITLLPPDSYLGQSLFQGQRLLADSGYLKIEGAVVVPASSPSLLDNTADGPVAIVGDVAAKQLGVASPGPGAQIWLRGRPVQVVGMIITAKRDPLLRRAVVFSYSSADLLSGYETALTVRTVPGYPAAIAIAAPLALNPANPGDVQVTTVADLRSLRRGVSQDLGTYIAIVSWILLALSSLSAGTAMYLSVRSRAPEIALRRALGASRGAVWRLFALEGAVIGAAGGIAGAAFGLLGVLAICQVQGWTPTLSPAFIGVGVVVGTASGLLSSIYPALVAAFSNPAEAIRG